MRTAIGARVAAALGIVVALGCGAAAPTDDDEDGRRGFDAAGQRKLGTARDAAGSGDAAAAEPMCAEDDPTTPGVECAGMVSCGGSAESPVPCSTATHSCCIAGYPSADTVRCQPGVDACGEKLVAPCDGPEDCGGGQVCCLFRTSGFVTRCAPSDECGTADLVQCHGDDDCPLGLACLASPHVPWWASCK